MVYTQGSLESLPADDRPDSHDKPPLTIIDDARPLYFLPKDNFAEEVLIPAFKAANQADCMVGFFSSSVLASLAPGLATYINSTDKSLRLIVSPYLSDADRNAIAEGLEKPEDIAAGVIKNLLITEDELQQHTLKCFSYLMRVGRLELKIALLEDGLFHPKVWLFRQGDTAAAAHGSSNMTTAGVHRNVEQITVSRSWLDPTQDYIINKLQEEFDSLWANKVRGRRLLHCYQRPQGD